jgi:hypothetical protein
MALKNALDDCLTRLEQGESIDACLARHARLRARLLPLLRAADGLRARRDVLHPLAHGEQATAALAHARARVLAHAEISRHAVESAPVRARPPQGPAIWSWGRAPARAFVTLACAIALLVSLFGGGSIVSANSLPGDPLYGVKRAGEKLRLAFVLSEAKRVELEQQFEALRLREVLAVVEQHREVEVDFAGAVDSVTGDTITVQGIAVRLSASAQVSAPPAVGSKVTVVANTLQDGSLEASLVAPAASAPASALATATSVPPEQRPTRTPVQPTPTEMASPTQMPSPESTSVPPTASPAENTPVPAPPTAAPTSTPISSPEPSATATLKPTATARPSATPTVKPSPTLAPPREVKVRIEGTIGEMTAAYWVVDGQRILLRATTQLHQEAAQAQVGGWAIAHAVIEQDGQIVAQEIVVVRGPERAPEPREFSGVIESLAETQWTLAGRTLLITPQTTISGSPQVGALAHVVAQQYADGRLVAVSIQVEDLELVQFAGLIEALLPDRWIVSGQEVRIVETTQIEGVPVVGAIAEIEAVASPDGTLTARRARIDTSTVQAGSGQ